MSSMMEIKGPLPKEIIGPLPKGHATNVVNAEETKSKFQTNYGHWFFMGKEFTFAVDIARCEHAPKDSVCKA